MRVRERCSDGKLPANVTAYLTMALAQFPEDDYEEVAVKGTGSLTDWGCWKASWAPPTSSAITQARKRLGREFMREVAARVFGPAAGPAGPMTAFTATGRARGAFLGDWRMLAIDGFDLDLADTPANTAAFGYAGSSGMHFLRPRGRSS